MEVTLLWGQIVSNKHINIYIKKKQVMIKAMMKTKWSGLIECGLKVAYLFLKIIAMPYQIT